MGVAEAWLVGSSSGSSSTGTLESGNNVASTSYTREGTASIPVFSAGAANNHHPKCLLTTTRAAKELSPCLQLYSCNSCVVCVGVYIYMVVQVWIWKLDSTNIMNEESDALGCTDHYSTFVTFFLDRQTLFPPTVSSIFLWILKIWAFQKHSRGDEIFHTE